MSDYIIKSNERALGGFLIHRSLPTAKKRHVGPFVFLDHIGPVSIDDKKAMDVRPHPHIGLATVTYFIRGRGLHRDSLGSVQVIEPGDINLMTAGRGIVHSERTPPEDRRPMSGVNMHGIQMWVGLPKDQEECEPEFKHYPKSVLPEIIFEQGLKARLMIGSYEGETSPVETRSRMLFMDILSEIKKEKVLSFHEKEVALFLVSGHAIVNDQNLVLDDLIVLSNPQNVKIQFFTDTRFIVVGGDPFPEERYMYWNFVSSSKERIRKAADDWKNQRFSKVPGETEYIPLPDGIIP